MQKQRVFSRIVGYALKYPFLFTLSIVLSVLFVMAKVGAAFFATKYFSNAFIERNISSTNWYFLFILIFLAFMWVLFHYLIFLSSNSLAMNVMHDIRRGIYEKVMELPMVYFKINKTGELISRIINDVQVMETFFINIMVELLIQPLTLISVVSILFFINFRLSLYFFMVAPILVIILGGIGAFVQKLAHRVQRNIANVTAVIQESIYGIEVIKGFAIEDIIKEKFRSVNKSYLDSTKKEIRIRFLGTPISEFLGAMGIVIILFLGAFIVNKGIVSTGDIISFITLSLILAEPLSKATDVFMIIKRLIPAGKRIFEIIDYQSESLPLLPPFGGINGKIEYKNVWFAYNDKDFILKDINLVIEESETVAIVGHSGAGKTTLVSLLLGFYRLKKGEILIDGKNIEYFDPLTIRKQVGIVTQENILFSGTIEDNIKLSKPNASYEEVVEASKIANAHSFISKLPDGYKTEIGDRGVRLSGGERQRIALARAILRKPRILILDEATSSLDAESEAMIQNAMESILGRQTTIIIAHKLSTVMKADKIVVLENGQIVEVGNHAELVSRGGIYHRLFSLNL